ncbi:MAG: protoporphyrinogen oxidase [Myxococcota bacterium]
MNHDVAVIGAGPAGLAVAWWLRQAGLSVVVLEASGRAGGLIQTLDMHGVLLEQGPQSLRGAGLATSRLIQEVGLASKVVPAAGTSKRRWVLHQGRLQSLPSTLAEWIRGDVVDRSTVLRALWEPFVRRGWKAGETLDHFIRRRFGPGVAEPFVDAFVGGIYAGDPRSLEAESAFPSLVAAERNFGSVIWGLWRNSGKAEPTGVPRGSVSFDDGVEMLPRALAEGLGDDVRYNAPVRAVQPTPTGAEVHTDGAMVRASHVVVATPLPTACALVPGWADVVGPMHHAPVAAVHLGWQAGRGPSMPGFGWLTASTERQDCLGTIWVSATFPHLAAGMDLVRVMVGGTRAPQLATLSERALVHHAMDVVCRVQGVVPEPALAHVARARPGIPQYLPGHAEMRRKLESHLPRVHPLGWGLTGVGLTQGFDSAFALAQRIIAQG